MLTSQNIALFIILTNPNIKYCASKQSKVQKISVKACVRDRFNIFSNIQLINKKFGSNNDGHVKEQS